LNKAQKAVEQVKLDQERAILKELERHYEYALTGINERLRVLQSMPETQSTVYHKEYQQVMKKQVTAILENLQANVYSSIDQYRHEAYNTGFVGTMYDLHYQNVPLLIPINRDAVLKAVQHDTKLTSPLYDTLGIDTKVMSKKISRELSRGLASGLTYDDIARNIRNTTKAPLARARNIARTEGHRIQQASAADARIEAKAKGADVVKQWDSTLDGDTRPNHRQLDGQIREIDEPFEVGRYRPMHPGDFGDPAEDCNCRCVALTRARAALDEDELKTLRERAEFFGLDKSDEFADFEKKYLKASEEAGETVPDPQKAEGAKAENHQVTNKFGQTVVFDKRMETDERWSESVSLIKQLTDEYDTRLTSVGFGSVKAAGDANMGGGIRLSSKKPDTAIHEFAHSITFERLTKYKVEDNTAFWKEIKAVKRAYRADVGDDSSRWISSYERSSGSVDEFFAEAFTQAKMHELGLPIPESYGKDLTYSKRVLAIVDKYFKK
jgi:SPP1 gp7 family putative phage head morphogenesis protein